MKVWIRSTCWLLLAIAEVLVFGVRTANAVTVSAGCTWVHAEHMQADASGTALTGTITFSPVATDGTPISFVTSCKNTGQAGKIAIATHVTDGAFGLWLPDTTATKPLNVCFRATAQTAKGTSVLGPGYVCVQPHTTATSVDDWCQAGNCDFGSYTPAMAALALVVVGPKGDTGAAGNATISSGSMDQYAKLDSASQMHGVSPATVLSDIGAQAADPNCKPDGSGHLSCATVAATASVSAPQHCIGSSCITAWPVGAVSSVFGRTGAVTAQTGDYSYSQLSGALPTPTGATLGGVKSYDCATVFGAGYGLQKINTDGSASCALFSSSGTSATLVGVASALTSNVTIGTTGTFFDGPSVALTAGTWHLTGAVTVQIGGGSNTVTCKLWDGTSVLASSQTSTGYAGWTMAIPFSGQVTLTGSDTYKISCTGTTSSDGTILAAATSNSAGNNASTLVAVAVSGGSGSGGGSGTINTGSAGQIAVYVGNGSTVGGVTTLPASSLPLWLDNKTSPLISGTGAQLLSLYDPALSYKPISQYTNKVSLQPVTSDYVYDQTIYSPTGSSAFGIMSDSSTYPASGTLIVSWNSASPGFTTGGMLHKVRFYPTANTNTGATINVWALHPTAALPTTTGGTASFSVIAQIGTIDGSAANTYEEFTGLNIPVSAGDVIAFAPVGRGMPFVTGDTRLSAFYTVFVSGHSALSSLTAGQTFSATAACCNAYLYTVEIAPGSSFVAPNQPGGVARLDASGNVPVELGRAVDMPWSAKKIIWVGTSIPAQYDAGPPILPAYPNLVGTALQANMDNEAVGSSGVVWDGTTSRCLTLMATTAQLTSVCGSNYAPQSYQTKVLGKSADMLVIDHGYNDAVSGTLSDIASITAYSASSGTLTLTAANNFTTGESLTFAVDSASDLAPLNGKSYTVLSSGLSSSQFAITTDAVTGLGTSKRSWAATTSTFYGAMQLLIVAAYLDNPSIRVVLTTPPVAISALVDKTAMIAAIQAIGTKWSLPVINTAAQAGLNATTYCASGTSPCTLYSYEGIHPEYLARQVLARILYQALKGL